MRLIKLQIKGFQCFKDSGEMIFTSGFNLIVGINNSGKSAILRALLPDLIYDSHRGLECWDDKILPEPHIRMQISFDGAELFDAAKIDDFHCPMPSGMDVNAYGNELFSSHDVRIEIERQGTQVVQNITYEDSPFASMKSGSSSLHFQIRSGHLYLRDSGGANTMSVAYQKIWPAKLFHFQAERMNIGVAPFRNAPRLSSDASNLPAVLHTLQNEQGDAFKNIVHHLREVIPTAQNVTIRPEGGHHNTHADAEIRIWPTENAPRKELSFPLRNSGTGVAQVLSILTAVTTATSAVIVIDEINSFLHPAATKKLLRILQTHYSHHQYIITTHAAEVLSSANPTTLHIVKRAGYESHVEQLKPKDVNSFKNIAQQLGISMTDVLAAERIIWVEGQTEELCFPLLYEYAISDNDTGLRPLPNGIAFISVVETGSLVGGKPHHKKLVFSIYQQLSTAASPIAGPAIFSFDRENLTARARNDLERASGNSIVFLPRRQFECYLIHPVAIAAMLCNRHPTRPITAQAVSDELTRLSIEAFKCDEWDGDIANPKWLSNVDAANLLKTVFENLCEPGTTFDKKRDGLTLVRLIREYDPTWLDELTTYVRNLVDRIGTISPS